MKKKIMFLTLLVAVFTVTACTGGSGQVLKCTMSEEEDGFKTDGVYSITFAGEEVEEVDIFLTMSVTTEEGQMGFSFISGMLSGMFSEYDDVDGVDINTEVKDDSLEVKMTIDYTKVDPADLEDLDMTLETEGMSIDEIKAEAEAEGLTCTIN